MKDFGDLTLHVVIVNQVDDFTAQQFSTLGSNKTTLRLPSWKREDKEGDITFSKWLSLLIRQLVVLMLVYTGVIHTSGEVKKAERNLW